MKQPMKYMLMSSLPVIDGNLQNPKCCAQDMTGELDPNDAEGQWYIFSCDECKKMLLVKDDT